MPLIDTSRRTAAYQPALAWFAAIGGAWVFALVMLGAYTTSIGAGMAFPDWPLSNGSLNPKGWLTDNAMFSEHADSDYSQSRATPLIADRLIVDQSGNYALKPLSQAGKRVAA